MQQPQQQQLQKQQKIWQDGLAEVKETFRRVALVKHTGFSVWQEPRSAPSLERVLRWNRQARNLSQVPHSLRARVPNSVLREISNNRSASAYVQMSHLQNVSGMCKRIRSQKSLSERRKNPFDTSMYPVFVRRNAALPMQEHHPPARPQSVPLFYTPQPFKLLYDISNNAAPPPSQVPMPASVLRRTEGKAYDKLFVNRPSSAMSSVKKVAQVGLQQQRRISSAPGQQRWWRRGSTPPTNEDGYVSSTPSQSQPQQQHTVLNNGVSIPKLCIPNSYEFEEQEQEQAQRNSRVVTFASPVVEKRLEKHRQSVLLAAPQVVEELPVQDREEEVMIKHSSDPYCDFRESMMSMIHTEGLSYGDHELEELFQYYMDLNPKMHHPVLARVIRDIKSHLINKED